MGEENLIILIKEKIMIPILVAAVAVVVAASKAIDTINTYGDRHPKK